MIETTQQVSQCPSCRAAVAEDQSYCLSCGARQARARKRVEQPAAGVLVSDSEVVHPGFGPERDWTPVVALGGLVLLALVLVIGVLIGRSGQGANKAAAAPQVIQLQGNGNGATPSSTSAGANSTAAAVGKISDEWPAGKSGWTVALQSLGKSGATPGSVTAAKSAAAAKGAKQLGVLDASNYTSLGSAYVIYSGVYTGKGQATAALAKLKKSFPSAKVIHVVQRGGGGGGGGGGGASSGPPPSAAQQQAGAAAIQSLSNCSGSACSKAARKITQPIATPGAPPPKDKKAAGGGSGGGQSFQ